MTCSSCGKMRNELTPKKSKLWPTTLMLCTSCIEKKYEPRWMIILYGRSNGLESVSKYVSNHLYEGPTIAAEDFVK